MKLALVCVLSVISFVSVKSQQICNCAAFDQCLVNEETQNLLTRTACGQQATCTNLMPSLNAPQINQCYINFKNALYNRTRTIRNCMNLQIQDNLQRCTDLPPVVLPVAPVVTVTTGTGTGTVPVIPGTTIPIAPAPTGNLPSSSSSTSSRTSSSGTPGTLSLAVYRRLLSELLESQRRGSGRQKRGAGFGDFGGFGFFRGFRRFGGSIQFQDDTVRQQLRNYTRCVSTCASNPTGILTQAISLTSSLNSDNVMSALRQARGFHFQGGHGERVKRGGGFRFRDTCETNLTCQLRNRNFFDPTVQAARTACTPATNTLYDDLCTCLRALVPGVTCVDSTTTGTGTSSSDLSGRTGFSRFLNLFSGVPQFDGFADLIDSADIRFQDDLFCHGF